MIEKKSLFEFATEYSVDMFVIRERLKYKITLCTFYSENSFAGDHIYGYGYTIKMALKDLAKKMSGKTMYAPSKNISICYDFFIPKIKFLPFFIVGKFCDYNES